MCFKECKDIKCYGRNEFLDPRYISNLTPKDDKTTKNLVLKSTVTGPKVMTQLWAAGLAFLRGHLVLIRMASGWSWYSTVQYL